MQGLGNISKRTLDPNNEYPEFAEPWDGPTNTKLKESLGKILRRVMKDKRLVSLDPRHDVASYIFPMLFKGDAEWYVLSCARFLNKKAAAFPG